MVSVPPTRARSALETVTRVRPAYRATHARAERPFADEPSDLGSGLLHQRGQSLCPQLRQPVDVLAGVKWPSIGEDDAGVLLRLEEARDQGGVEVVDLGGVTMRALPNPEECQPLPRGESRKVPTQ